MILTGPEIAAAIKRGDIACDPFDPAHVGPASLDLTLSDELLVYRRVVGEDWRAGGASRILPLDMAAENQFDRLTMPAHPRGFELEPGRLYIGSTNESVRFGQHAVTMMGRSSVGRLGIAVHVSAGFGDPLFYGTLTLEITAVEPVVIYPNVRICQIVFAQTVGRPSGYAGKYNGQSGPRASEMWRDFAGK